MTKRTLAAWQKGDKFFLSAFREGQRHVNPVIDTPAAEFNSEADLMAEVRRRKVLVDWEYKETLADGA